MKACDVAITKHLKEGNSINDEVGTELARQIAHESLQMERVQAAAVKHGLDESMLGSLYQRMVSSLMPEPLIRHAGPILAPSLMFMDDAEFENQLDLITRFGQLHPEREEEFEAIQNNAAQLAIQLRDRANSMRGSIRLADANTAGCGATAAVIMLAIVSFRFL